MVVALVGGQHMHLLIALGNQVDYLLLAGEQRRQGGRRIGMLGQQTVFGFTIVSQFPVKQAERLPQRLFAPQSEPEPVKHAVPQRTESVDQQWFPDGHIARQAQGKDSGDQRRGQQARVQRTDLRGDAEQ